MSDKIRYSHSFSDPGFRISIRDNAITKARESSLDAKNRCRFDYARQCEQYSGLENTMIACFVLGKEAPLRPEVPMLDKALGTVHRSLGTQVSIGRLEFKRILDWLAQNWLPGDLFDGPALEGVADDFYGIDTDKLQDDAPSLMVWLRTLQSMGADPFASPSTFYGLPSHEQEKVTMDALKAIADNGPVTASLGVLAQHGFTYRP